VVPCIDGKIKKEVIGAKNKSNEEYEFKILFTFIDLNLKTSL